MPAPVLRHLPELVSLVFGAAAWELLGRFLQQPALPPLSTVLSAMWTLAQQGEFRVVEDSLRHLVIAVSLALVAGLAVGCLLVISKRLERLVLPYVNAAMALPVVAFVPLFILIFGFRSGPRIATIVTYALFVVIVNTFAGARAVDPELLEMAQATGASPLRTFVSIRLPACLPLVMEGIAIGVSRGIIGMVTGEYLVATAGVGGLLLNFAQNYRLPELYATVLLVLLFAVLVYGVFRFLESRVIAWSTGTT